MIWSNYIVKMTILPKAIKKFQPMHLKITKTFFYRNRKKIKNKGKKSNSEICVEPQKTTNSQRVVKQKEQRCRNHTI